TRGLAGREWTRLAGEDEIADGARRVFEFEAFDLVVLRKGEKYFACNNSCPHMHLPFFEKRDATETGIIIKSPTGREIPRDSRATDDLGLVCRWHETCFDLQTGEARNWARSLQADGTSKGWEFIGDVSKNRTPIKPIALPREGRLPVGGAGLIGLQSRWEIL